MANIKIIFLDQLNQSLDLYDSTLRMGKVDPDTDERNYAHNSTSMIGAIYRASGPDSIYMKQANGFLADKYISNAGKLAYVAGVVMSLRDDITNGYLDSARELIHGDLFSDFLEMAQYLLDEGYKDAAAVIGGGVLETHLHQLCIKNSISLDYIDNNGQTKPKKADRLNADLAGNNVYSKGNQKSVTAWLDTRNEAAHAQYSSYTKEEVALFLQGIRDFITRYPA